MPTPKLVTFDSMAGVPCYYARTNSAYSDLSKTTKSRKRKLHPAFLKQMEAMIAELFWVTMSLGPLKAITSGGAYVRKAGWHSKGKAYDLGGLHWASGRVTCLDAQAAREAGNPVPVYLGCEAIIRRHFGTVLGIHHNEAHHNHWHIDPGTKVGYWTKGFGATTRVVFLQASLKTIWGLYEGAEDGSYGPKTRKAVRSVCFQLSLFPLARVDAWRQFLLLTAMAGVQMRSR